jgi:hypothetical protein
MTKKDWSPSKNMASPNPHPKQCNKTPPSPLTPPKEHDTPMILTVSTSSWHTESANFYASLQDDPLDDSKLTLNPNDESQYKLAGEGSVILTPNTSNKMEKNKNQQTSASKFILHHLCPKESIRQSVIKSPANPIAAIPPSDLE